MFRFLSNLKVYVYLVHAAQGQAGIYVVRAQVMPQIRCERSVCTDTTVNGAGEQSVGFGSPSPNCAAVSVEIGVFHCHPQGCSTEMDMSAGDVSTRGWSACARAALRCHQDQVTAGLWRQGPCEFSELLSSPAAEKQPGG